MNPLLLTGLSYLLGSTPTSYWVGRTVHGVDLRSVGSGNLGATNAFRVFGWRSALPVLIVDVGKGWAAVWLFARLDAPDAAWGWALAYGGAAIVGHIFSVWVRFRGGKGVATSAGVVLAVAPWALLVCAAAFVIVLASTRLVSFGSLVAALFLPPAIWFTPSSFGPEARGGLFGFACGLAAFVLWAHRSNIRRILRGEEQPIDRARAVHREEAGATAGAPPDEGEVDADATGRGAT